MWNIRKGFTLVELLLFTGIIAIMGGAMVSFSLVSSNLSAKNEVISEVEQGGDIVLQRFVRTVGELTNTIIYPASGKSADELVLAEADGTRHSFYKHGDRIAYEKDDEVSYLTTKHTVMRYLRFLHFGSKSAGEGVSIIFQAGNAAFGTEIKEDQYTRVFRATATLHPERSCVVDSDCTGVCCDGECRTVCGDCDSCTDDEVCCLTDLAGEGTRGCVNLSTNPTDCKCVSLDDCSGIEPSCDTVNCELLLPACNTGVCESVALSGSDPCPGCSTCGDGIKDALLEEECDDGDLDISDSCCDCFDAYCGDGHLWNTDGGSEECDDGNTLDGDGCSSACMNEDLCGTDDEECSPAGTLICDAFCRLTYCGDGTVQNPNGEGISEQCDSTALCSSGCKTITANECGNGILEVGEECDDGKRCTDNGDSCVENSDCNNNICSGFGGDGCANQ